jgi:glycosyltransferase involved in cell wall biosynthesis
MKSEYSVLIRTKNSSKTLRLVIESIKEQTISPLKILAVDSGSTDATISILGEMGVERLDYPSSVAFNYSHSLNVGFAALTSPLILCLSSHTVLHSRNTAEELVNAVTGRSDSLAGYAVVYPSSCAKPDGPLHVREIGLEQFDGYNGLWNTCSLVRRSAWQAHPFPLDVWTAEDQAWAAWHFHNRPKSVTLRLEGLDVEYLNPYQSQWKGVSEFVSIATHAFPKVVRWRNLLRGICSALWHAVRNRKLSGHYGLQLPICLVLYRLKLLEFRSNYHDGPPAVVRHLFNSPESKPSSQS